MESNNSPEIPDRGGDIRNARSPFGGYEDSPTEGLCNLSRFHDLDIHSRSQLRLTRKQMFYLSYNSNISDKVSAMAFKLGMTVDFCMFCICDV